MTGKLMIVSEQAGHIFNELTWITRLPMGDGFIRIPASKIGEYLKECYARRATTPVDANNTSSERV